MLTNAEMQTFLSYSPRTGEATGVHSVSDATAVSLAVGRARNALETWRARTPKARCAALLRLRALIAEESDAYAQTISDEIGKPLQEAYGADVLPSLTALKWLGESAPNALKTRRIRGGKGATRVAEPVGVVGVIGTWNYPLLLNLAPIAWALAAGNAVVWKPSEFAPETAHLLETQAHAAGLPLFVVWGEGETGRNLCRAGCDKIAFTGGVNTGRAILAQLAEFGTPSVMELSGCDPMIVCADADLTLAAKSAVWGRVCNAGQSCVAPQRFYVVQSLYPAFVAACAEILKGLEVEADYGPMRTAGLRERAESHIAESVRQGARQVLGGARLPERAGYYLSPALLAFDATAPTSMELEVFGPVLSVHAVHDDNEALRHANANTMALGASVWTASRKRAQWFSERLDAGTVSINDVLLDAANPVLPFGGRKASGFGKQRGVEGLFEFTHFKVVVTHGVKGERRHLFPYRAATLPILRGVVALQRAEGFWEKCWSVRNLVQAAMQWNASENRARGLAPEAAEAGHETKERAQ